LPLLRFERYLAEEMESSLPIPNPGIYINGPASPLLISLNIVHQSFLLKLKLCLLNSYTYASTIFIRFNFAFISLIFQYWCESNSIAPLSEGILSDYPVF